MSSNTGGWEVKSLVGVHISTSQLQLANGSKLTNHNQTETVKYITNCIPEQLASSVATSFHINHSQSGSGPWGPVTVTTWEGSMEGPRGPFAVTTWKLGVHRQATGIA